MTTRSKHRPDWTVVLRRRPVRIVEGRPEGGWTGEFEIICRDCGDDPDLDYREVSPELQRIRGPYPLRAGVTAYEEHVRQHPSPQIRSPGRRSARQVNVGRRPG
jgi:hypothetical protein